MRVLFVCSANSGRIAPFIGEQAASLREAGLEVEIFTVRGAGVAGYMANLKTLRAAIDRYRPEIVHAHYGLTGLLACLQRRLPVVTTFHGSDLNDSRVRPLSKLTATISAHSIFVSERLAGIAGRKSRYTVQPCGVDVKRFRPVGQAAAREFLGLATNKKLVLFAGSFSNPVKNPPLAQKAVSIYGSAELRELKNFSREETALHINACDLLLLTSHTEGSSQVVKEAMACGIPVVATPAGDAEWLFSGLEGHYLCSYDPADVAEKIRLALEFSATKGRTTGRQRILELGLDLRSVALRIQRVYESVCP